MSKALFDTEIEYSEHGYSAPVDDAEAELLNTGGRGRPVMTAEEQEWSDNFNAKLPRGGYPLIDYVLIGAAVILLAGVVVGMIARMLGIL